MLNRVVRAAALVAAMLLLLSKGACAQSIPGSEAPQPALSVAAPELVNPNVKAGPTIYLADSYGQLGTLTLGTYSVHRIGYEGVLLTDIAFNPKDHQLYGISFNAFYRVNPHTGRATFIGDLGIHDANALVFDANGKAYTEGYIYSELWTIDIKTGRVSPIGSTYPFKSAGDLTFYNGGLVLSAYYQSALNANTPDTLALLNPGSGRPLAYSELRLANLFGIVSTGPNVLIGFAGTGVYQIYPGAKNIAQRTLLLKNFAGHGLSTIDGAAYDGYFQN